MSAPWAKEAGEHLQVALEAALKLAEGPRREVLVRGLRSCNEALARPNPDASMLAGALRLATPPAMVLASEDATARAIAAALGSAYNASLASLRPGRLEAAKLPLLTDGLTSINRDGPRTVSVVRAPFDPNAEDFGLIEIDEVEEIDEAGEVGEAGEVDHDEERDGAGEDAPAAPRALREDWRPAEGVAPERPTVRLLEDRRTLDLAGYRAAIVEQCLEAIAALARDRAQDPLSARAGSEPKILAAVDAVLASGGACVATILAWWERSTDSPSPWCSWAAPFVLGCIEGADALLAVRCGLERLAPDADAHGEQAAEALALVVHADRRALGIDLAGSPHPIARAVGVDVLARAGQLTLEQLRQHLFDGNPTVVAAALRAITRMSSLDGAPLAPLLERWIHFPNATVAELSARALLRWGHDRPYDDLRSGGRLGSIVGARAVQLLVLAGSKLDLVPIQTLVARAARTPALLDALGRFGHPGVAPFLVHHLADEDLADAASDALVTLFGPCVAPDALLSGPAWRAALAALKPDPGVRYRRGEPWKPSGVAAECASGELARTQMSPRIDELAVRARVEAPVDLGVWSPGVQPMLDGLLAAAVVSDRAWPASGWLR